MSDRIEQQVNLAPDSQATVVGVQNIVTNDESIASPTEVMANSERQCTITRNKVGKKYRSGLYIEREQDSGVFAFMTGESSSSGTECMVLTERAGSGKTNLLCKMSEKLTDKGFPTVFILGSDVLLNRNDFVIECMSIFGLRDAKKPAVKNSIKDFLTLTKKPLCILIDGVNEARSVDMLRQCLSELFATISDLHVRILITCRDIYWPFIEGEWIDIIKTDIRSVNLYYYDDKAWVTARQRYFEEYSISGRLVEDAEMKCRQPLLFRFFCEAYEGEDISTIQEIRLKPLFRVYLKKKVKKMVQNHQSLHAEEHVCSILYSMVSEILRTKQTTIPERRIAEITHDREFDRDSLYVRLLNEDIIIEEVPDPRSRVLMRQARFVYEAFLEFIIAQHLEAKWQDVPYNDVISELEELFKPSLSMKNMLGAIAYLDDFLKARNINILQMFARKGPTWQNLAIQSIAECDPEDLTKAHIQTFHELLNYADPKTRASAIKLLEYETRRLVLDPRYDTLLSAACHDKNAGVRVQALSILSDRWSVLSTENRLTLAELAFDRSREVRREAKGLLSTLKQKEEKLFFTRFKKAFSSDSSQRRSYAAQMLNLNKWPCGRYLFVEALADDSHWVRSACLIGLSKFPSSEDADRILPLLKDTVPRVRSWAATVCGKWLFDSMYSSLIERVDFEEDPKVLSHVLAAIRQFNKPSSLPIFERFIGHPDHWVFYQAAKGLIELEQLRALDTIIPYIQQQNMTLHEGSLKIFPLIGKSAVIELCNSGFVSPDVCPSSGAFLAGVYADPESDTKLYKQITEMLVNVPYELQVEFLMGICLSDIQRSSIIRNKAFKNYLHGLITSGENEIRGIAARIIISKAGSFSRDERKILFASSCVETWKHIALGLLKYSERTRYYHENKQYYPYEDIAVKLLELSKEEESLRQYIAGILLHVSDISEHAELLSVLVEKMQTGHSDSYIALLSIMIGNITKFSPEVRDIFIKCASAVPALADDAMILASQNGLADSHTFVRNRLSAKSSVTIRMAIDASIAIGALFVRSNCEQILRHYQNRNRAVRVQVCRAAQMMDWENVESTLKRLIEDTEQSVRREALIALDKHLKEEAIPYEILALDDPSELVRVEVCQLLAQYYSEEIQEQLVRHLYDNSTRVRVEVQKILLQRNRPLLIQHINLHPNEIYERGIDYDLSEEETPHIFAHWSENIRGDEYKTPNDDPFAEIPSRIHTTESEQLSLFSETPLNYIVEDEQYLNELDPFFEQDHDE